MIYISGQITGNDTYEIDFMRGEIALRRLGYKKDEIVNPIKIEPYQNKDEWKNYMISDIKKLVECDAIFMLSGWIFSRGARIERKIAKALKMEIIYE